MCGDSFEKGFATEREPGMLEVLLLRDGDGVVYIVGNGGRFPLGHPLEIE